MAGMSNKEIARDLDLGVGTVKIHVAGFFEASASRTVQRLRPLGCARRPSNAGRSQLHPLYFRRTDRYSVQRGYLQYGLTT